MQVPAEAARILERVHRGGESNSKDIARLVILYIEQPRFILSVISRSLTNGHLPENILAFVLSYFRAGTDDKSLALVRALVRYCIELNSASGKPRISDDLLSKNSIRYWIHHLVEAALDESYVPPSFEGSTGTFADLTWVLREFCMYLNALGKNKASERISGIWAEWENGLRHKSDSLALTQSFYENIGHSIILQSIKLAQDQKLFIDKKTTVAPGFSPDNKVLCQILSPVYSQPSPYSHFEQISGFKPYQLSDGRVLGVSELISQTLDRHFRGGGRPPLPLDEKVCAIAESALRDAGLCLQEPFVTVHVREAGFDPNSARATQTRNANILSYRKAMELLVASGFQVVRMGDRTMRRLSETHGILDYPFSSAKSEEADLYLISKCAFHIGTSSGLSLMPLLFDRPILFTNWLPIGDEVWSRRTLFLTKKIRALSGRWMSTHEVREDFPSLYRPEHMVAAGFYPVDNTSEEISIAVAQMISFVDRGAIHQECFGVVDVEMQN